MLRSYLQSTRFPPVVLLTMCIEGCIPLVTFIDQLPSGFCLILPSTSVFPVMLVQALPWYGTLRSFSSTPLSVVRFYIDPTLPQPLSGSH